MHRETTGLNKEMKERLSTFLAALPVEEIATRIGRESGKDKDEIRKLLAMYGNETYASLELVRHQLSQGKRTLEAGAGLCLFSLFLKSEGFDVTALEPATGGFDLFSTMKKVILDHYAELALDVLEFPAQALSPGITGRFDLIFSNNVIEHIPDWHGALDGMMSVLNEGGEMLHTCPNYSVPYEPHFGIPVLRCCPTLSARLFSGRLATHPGLWESLNFINQKELTVYCRSNGWVADFEPELLYRALIRLDSDPGFRERHTSPVVLGGYSLLKSLGLLRLIRRLPPRWTTPMTFTIRRGATH